MRADGERVALAAFVRYNFAVATNPIAVRFSNRELSPLWGAGLRFGLAALLLVGLMVVLGTGAFHVGGPSAERCMFGALNFALAFGLAYYAFVRVHAGSARSSSPSSLSRRCCWRLVQRQERISVRPVTGRRSPWAAWP